VLSLVLAHDVKLQVGLDAKHFATLNGISGKTSFCDGNGKGGHRRGGPENNGRLVEDHYGGKEEHEHNGGKEIGNHHGMRSFEWTDVPDGEFVLAIKADSYEGITSGLIASLFVDDKPVKVTTSDGSWFATTSRSVALASPGWDVDVKIDMKDWTSVVDQCSSERGNELETTINKQCAPLIAETIFPGGCAQKMLVKELFFRVVVRFPSSTDGNVPYGIDSHPVPPYPVPPSDGYAYCDRAETDEYPSRWAPGQNPPVPRCDHHKFSRILRRIFPYLLVASVSSVATLMIVRFFLRRSCRRALHGPNGYFLVHAAPEEAGGFKV